MPGQATPPHADMTAFLLARGADPHAPDPRTSAEADAGLPGHWLAAEIIRDGRIWYSTNPARTGVNRLRLAAGLAF